MKQLLKLAERGMLPDIAIRSGIRHLLKERLNQFSYKTEEETQEGFAHLVDQLRQSPIAIDVAKANEQHYEVPTTFYQYVLGARMKYSSCYFKGPTDTLDQAEERMLALTAKRAELAPGQRILELGCGWGSLTLWMAEHFPENEIVAVSNSSTQKQHIDLMAKKKGFKNITVLTSDINHFDISQKFDRIVSVEMFEHMRNYEKLLGNIYSWLNPQGKLFVHIFTHCKYPYFFEPKGASDWMSHYFFTGGIMPSDHLLLYFQKHTVLQRQWVVDGTHYQRTARAWLENMDKNKKQILPILAQSYGEDKADIWFCRWRIFFMACEELWGYQGGRQWRVCHYLFERRS